MSTISFRTTLGALALASLFAVSVPFGTAAGPDYAVNGTFPGALGAYGFKEAHNYDVYLRAGDQITATLEWYDGLTDLDLRLISPGGACAITPEPDVDCLVGSAAGRASCSGTPTGGFPLSSSPEAWTRTVAVEGWYIVSVQVAFGTGTTDIDYHMAIDVAGDDQNWIGPAASNPNYLGESFCRLL